MILCSCSSLLLEPLLTLLVFVDEVGVDVLLADLLLLLLHIRVAHVCIHVKPPDLFMIR
jgi:hypothetical protein